MPLYEYVCPACGHTFEKRVSFSDSDRPQVCPKCGHQETRRQISRIGLVGGSSGGYAAPACGPSA